MKRILCATLLATALATPSLAAKLYLKDGGVIQAQRVWREDGRVYVLATRDTMTSFEPNEVDLKRTFPKVKAKAKVRSKRHKAVHRRIGAVRPTAGVPPRSAGEVSAPPKPVEQPKSSLRLPSLPKLPQKSPESLIPSKGGDGSIRQHKKKMQERLGE